MRAGVYAARLSAVGSGGSYAYARGSLGSGRTEVVAAGDFYIETEGASGGNVPLLRLFNPAGGRLVTLYRQNGTSNRLWLEHSGNYSSTTGTLTRGRWARVEVRLVTAGTGASTAEVRLDGALVYQTASASLGTTGVATIQIGNDTQNQAFTLYADDIAVTQPASVDTAPPETTVTSGPSGTVSNVEATFAFSANEAGSTFECRLDGGTWTACTSPTPYTSLNPGPHTFDARATDTAGNTDPTPATRSWTVDTAPPDTTVDSGPEGTTGSADAIFAFSATEVDASFQCRLDGWLWEACVSPVQHLGLADGPHTFEVRAVDAAGTLDPTPALAGWTVDTTSPATVLESGPTGATSSPDATLTFSATAAGASFDCRLDGAPWEPCASPVTLTGLAEGAHTFEVRAVDGLGITDPTPALARWSVDTVVPDTTFESAPAGTVTSRLATFTLLASEGEASFECRLDGGPWEPCASPHDLDGLSHGAHTFEARAVDSAGNTDPTAALATWDVDATAPGTTIDSGPSGVVSSADATFAFSTPEEGASLECRTDGGPWEPCVSPIDLSGLPDGAHTFEVRAVDSLGNTDPTPALRSWAVDTAPPDTTIVMVSGPAPAASSPLHSTATEAFVDAYGRAVRLKGMNVIPVWSSRPGTTWEQERYLQIRDKGFNTVRFVLYWDDFEHTQGAFNTTHLATLDTAISRAKAAGLYVILDAIHLWGSGGFADVPPWARVGDSITTVQTNGGGYIKMLAGRYRDEPAVVAYDLVNEFQRSPLDQNAVLRAYDSLIIEMRAVEPDKIVIVEPLNGDTSIAGSLADFANLTQRHNVVWSIHNYFAGGDDDGYKADGTKTGTYVWNGTTGYTSPNLAELESHLLVHLNKTRAAGIPMWIGELGIGSGVTNHDLWIDHQISLYEKYGLGHAWWEYYTSAPLSALNRDYSWKPWVDRLLPSATTVSSDPVFAFSASEAGARFECRLDDGPWEACSSPAGLVGLAAGAHTFEVRAIDAAGNTDPAPAVATWETATGATPALETTSTDGSGSSVPTSSASPVIAAMYTVPRFRPTRKRRRRR